MQQSGHEVAVATAPDFASQVEQVGLSPLPAGIPLHVMRQARGQMTRRGPIADPALAAVRRFAAVAPAMLDDLLGVTERFRPDLIVHEEAEMAGPVAARLTGVPNVNHSWASPVIPPAHATLIEQEMAPLWQRHGLAAEPAGGRYRYLHLDVCPPSLQDARDAGIANVQLMRPEPVDASRATPVALPWLETLGSRPLIYVTLGTVPLFNQSLSLFRAAIEGLRDDDVELVAALWDTDPAELGPRPANVHVERSVPQSAVLARAAAAVVHGGPGSTVAALAYGVPLLVLPPQAPIFHRVADAVARSGAGRVLAAAEATPDAFRREVRLLLEDPAYLQAAARVRDEIDGMPSPASVVQVLERLAAS